MTTCSCILFGCFHTTNGTNKWSQEIYKLYRKSVLPPLLGDRQENVEKEMRTFQTQYIDNRGNSTFFPLKFPNRIGSSLPKGTNWKSQQTGQRPTTLCSQGQHSTGIIGWNWERSLESSSLWQAGSMLHAREEPFAAEAHILWSQFYSPQKVYQSSLPGNGRLHPVSKLHSIFIFL